VYTAKLIEIMIPVRIVNILVKKERMVMMRILNTWKALMLLVATMARRHAQDCLALSTKHVELTL